jgi:hypothetical protein
MIRWNVSYAEATKSTVLSASRLFGKVKQLL